MYRQARSPAQSFPILVTPKQPHLLPIVAPAVYRHEIQQLPVLRLAQFCDYLPLLVARDNHQQQQQHKQLRQFQVVVVLIIALNTGKQAGLLGFSNSGRIA